ncbi:SPW repeat protein [Methylobacterium sp. PvR107]|uniref:SPW repeat protein n=1 Tax=Methylobacterium sp. PvR107 TaxID=2806597 RepID=UPI001AE4A4FF|nr:SPW repeat protein [Methylobacterium sp. PvR107]MBP1179911.1 membrane protein YdbS with pleckstrin-like domain [Methylobacterium sp. PvR107]
MRTIENRTEDMVPNALNILFGVALVLAPWYLGLGYETAAARNAFISGGAITVIAVVALGKTYDWEEYLNLALGLWVSIAPWVLGFAEAGPPMWVHVVFGLAVAAFAAFELWRLFVSPQARSV